MASPTERSLEVFAVMEIANFLTLHLTGPCLHQNGVTRAKKEKPKSNENENGKFMFFTTYIDLKKCYLSLV